MTAPPALESRLAPGEQVKAWAPGGVRVHLDPVMLCLCWSVATLYLLFARDVDWFWLRVVFLAIAALYLPLALLRWSNYSFWAVTDRGILIAHRRYTTRVLPERCFALHRCEDPNDFDTLGTELPSMHPFSLAASVSHITNGPGIYRELVHPGFSRVHQGPQDPVREPAPAAVQAELWPEERVLWWHQTPARWDVWWIEALLLLVWLNFNLTVLDLASYRSLPGCFMVASLWAVNVAWLWPRLRREEPWKRQPTLFALTDRRLLRIRGRSTVALRLSRIESVQLEPGSGGCGGLRFGVRGFALGMRFYPVPQVEDVLELIQPAMLSATR